MSLTETARAGQRFQPEMLKLTCPIHDNMPFKFFCKESQNYLCNICVLDRNTGIST
jgi:hypothetical protein